MPVIQDIVEAKGLMVIKTIPGNASNTAFFIDGAGRYEIAGTIAGDDTILDNTQGWNNNSAGSYLS